MMKTRIYGLSGLIFCLYLWNASWWGAPQVRDLDIQAHRGLSQNFSTVDLTRDSCTATRIDPPRHRYIENTTRSMQAALDAGATQIELDIHPLIDGEFAVFHDWTLECRTNGQGRTRDKTWAELRALDIGYGYTADNGQSFPFRGQFIGAMPRLSDVLTQFPDTHLTINIKDRSRDNATALLSYIPPQNLASLEFVGHETPMSQIKRINPDLRVMSRERAKSCLTSYTALGWSGYVPKPCQNMTVPVPANFRRLLWGWPYKFEARLNKAGSRSMLLGPLSAAGSTGIDSAADLKYVPARYSGIVFTNKADIVAPILKARRVP